LTVCETCGGVGFSIVSREGREYAEPCSCRRNSAESPEAQLAGCGVPPRYEHCVFDNFDRRTPSQAAARDRAERYVEGYPHLGPQEGLGVLFTGGNGVGKTHLAVAILRSLVERKGVRGRFWDFHELIREIRNSYDSETKTSELQVLEPVVEADVLVLDDLGAWKMTDWMNDTLFYLLNSRYTARRPTVVTTNYQDADLEKIKSADPLVRREYLVERIGQRLRSRLMEMCVAIPMDGPDMRRIQQDVLRHTV